MLLVLFIVSLWVILISNFGVFGFPVGVIKKHIYIASNAPGTIRNIKLQKANIFNYLNNKTQVAYFLHNVNFKKNIILAEIISNLL